MRIELAHPTHAKLVAGPYRYAVLENYLHHLFAGDLPALLISQGCQDLLGLGVDNFAGGWIGIAAVEAESDPTRLVAKGNTHDLLGRDDVIVEDVDPLVRGISEIGRAHV